MRLTPQSFGDLFAILHHYSHQVVLQVHFDVEDFAETGNVADIVDRFHFDAWNLTCYVNLLYRGSVGCDHILWKRRSQVVVQNHKTPVSNHLRHVPINH